MINQRKQQQRQTNTETKALLKKLRNKEFKINKHTNASRRPCDLCEARISKTN